MNQMKTTTVIKNNDCNVMKLFFILCFSGLALTGNSQSFTELRDTKPHDSEQQWNALKTAYDFEWGNTDTRYPKLSIPNKPGMENKEGNKKLVRLTAWRGERVSAQAVLYTKKQLKDASISVSELKNSKGIIPSSAITVSPVRYVMTDELNKDGKGGCGQRPDPTKFDSSIVADILDHNAPGLNLEKNTTQPLWLSVNVPSNAAAGKYTGTINLVVAGKPSHKLQIELEVKDRVLPAPSEWAFHLDLWQNPFAVARYHNVTLWSKEHFDLMRPLMKMLADAGQKIVTTTIMHRPWAGQTQDAFSSMVTKTKEIDGSWRYDYSVFDKWVTFMMEDVGITDQINCYSMIPWALNFDFFDKASDSIQFVHAKPGSTEFDAYWKPFLEDFARHLKSKGWFEKTTIAMDERSLADMQATIKLIKSVDKNFKVSLAGNYHGEIEADIYDYCIAFGQTFPDAVKSTRSNQGKPSTVYTCCAEAYPNTFTFSAPAEATWIGWHTAAGNYDGYLRWAYNSWTTNPLQDSRFRTWAAGDCYLVYPDGRSSIRFERLREGIQDYEKIRILKNELGANSEKFKSLRSITETFTLKGKQGQSTESMVNKAKKLLNSL